MKKHSPARATSLPHPALASAPALPRDAAAFVAPMKCERSTTLPTGPEWVYELKLDGIRALATKSPRAVRLYSRTHHDLTGRFAEVARALETIPERDLILDGEVVALDAEGRPSFQTLQRGDGEGTALPPVYYYVFDLLREGRVDLTHQPFEHRRRRLETLGQSFRDPLRVSPILSGSPQAAVASVTKLGLEGIVAKDRHSPYRPGVRSRDWVKYKTSQEQEFVIGGFTAPAGSRLYFGAVLVGYYEGRRLQFASKVGTGFDLRGLASLNGRFEKIRRTSCPFANLPEPAGGRWSRGLTATAMRSCTWVEPRLVCQVRFAEWTRDGHLRQPVFLGLRDDKAPRDVIRE